MKRRIAPLVAFVPACLLLQVCLLPIAACSSRPVETGLTSGPVSGRPVQVGMAAAASHPSTAAPQAHRPVRPIPVVISKPKPFRMAPEKAAKPLPRPTRDSISAEPIAAASASSGVETASAAMAPPMASRPSAGPDVAGINRMMRSYLQAFNRHDPAALAAHWSDAGENVDLDSGETTAGREAVHDVFAALFEEDAGATIDIDVASIRSLRDDVAVVDGVSRISFTDAPPSSSRFSAVLVREGGSWVLDTVRAANASAHPDATESAGHAPARPLDELDWLVGSWEDVSEGVTASMHCFWSANRAFLIRTHVVSSDGVQEQRPLPGDSRIPGLLSASGAGSREITEIIGWDQDRGQIRSWLFTSDGRFAEGSWSREGDAWTLRLEDASGDCHCTLTRTGPDAMSCRCDSDRFVDIVPPACDFTRTAHADSAMPGPGRR